MKLNEEQQKIVDEYMLEEENSDSDNNVRHFPSHKRIANYWFNKCISKDGKIIDINNKRDDDMIVIEDYGEPECWLCGKPFHLHNSEKNNYYKLVESENEKDIESIYDLKSVKSSLERCHIVPHSLGGSDDEDNLFLLCKKCHAQSPDVLKKEYFLKYIYDKRKEYIWGYHFSEFLSNYKYLEKLCEMNNKDISKFDLKEFDISNEKIKEEAMKFCSTHGATLSLSSIMSFICEKLPYKDDKKDFENIFEEKNATV